ncbi:MAG TPA: carboxypeptidase regulatory-like domain-containing protein, partial [Bryobacteraceae bacterium]|nr:carboxypeptidase regulatory-like domain-containing protein [Bryobacteraceae bacterium]
QPHRFVTNITYELPFGRGKQFGAGVIRVVDAVLGNWQVNGILTISKGLPLRNFSLSSNTCFCFGGTQRPNSTGTSAALSEGQTIDRWFDTRQIVAPASFTFGNLGRTLATVRSDNARNLDFSIFKSFRPTERVGVQFRAEAFNLTNTPLIAQPNTQVGSPLFGAVTSQENNPRQIQLGLKILF